MADRFRDWSLREMCDCDSFPAFVRTQNNADYEGNRYKYQLMKERKQVHSMLTLKSWRCFEIALYHLRFCSFFDDNRKVILSGRQSVDSADKF